MPRRGRRGVAPQGSRIGAGRCAGIRNPRSRDMCMKAEAERAQQQANLEMNTQQVQADLAEQQAAAAGGGSREPRSPRRRRYGR